jgi:hypothetical protein
VILQIGLPTAALRPDCVAINGKGQIFAGAEYAGIPFGSYKRQNGKW